MANSNDKTTALCPHCHKPILSPRALGELNFARDTCRTRGFIWEGARLSYEAGTYRDAEIAELLAVGAIAPHPDPSKGWIVKW